MKYAIVDIDGTVADLHHRLHLIKTKPKNWALFDQLTYADQPMLSNIDRIGKEIKDRNLGVVFLTGRSEKTRAMTEAWLKQYVPFYMHGRTKVFMRKHKDHVPAADFKTRMIQEIIPAEIPDFEPVIAFDDTDPVIKAINALVPTVDVKLFEDDYPGVADRRLLESVRLYRDEHLPALTYDDFLASQLDVYWDTASNMVEVTHASEGANGGLNFFSMRGAEYSIVQSRQLDRALRDVAYAVKLKQLLIAPVL